MIVPCCGVLSYGAGFFFFFFLKCTSRGTTVHSGMVGASMTVHDNVGRGIVRHRFGSANLGFGLHCLTETQEQIR